MRCIPKKFTFAKEIPTNVVVHVTMHPSVRKIHGDAFREHEHLLSVNIPRSVRSIGENKCF